MVVRETNTRGETRNIFLGEKCVFLLARVAFASFNDRGKWHLKKGCSVFTRRARISSRSFSLFDGFSVCYTSSRPSSRTANPLIPEREIKRERKAQVRRRMTWTWKNDRGIATLITFPFVFFSFSIFPFLLEISLREYTFSFNRF